MRLSFKYIKKDINEKTNKIIEDIIWHGAKVYNTLLYELREEKRKIDKEKSINIIQTPIYKEYRKENWHSGYLHLHTLQQIIINVVQNYKSYLRAKEEYEKDKTKFKGEPKEPRYKGNSIQEIIFTKYAIRIEKNIIKLSISKKMLMSI